MNSERDVVRKPLVQWLMYFMVLFSFFASQQFSNWPLVKFWNASPPGTLPGNDLRGALEAFGCYKKLSAEELFSKSILSECPENLYGISAAIYAWALGLGVEDVAVITWVNIIMMSGLLAYLVWGGYHRGGFSGALIATAMAVSPPVHYLLERGNLDIQVFLLTFLASWFVSIGAFRTAIFLFSVGASLKFYSVAMIGASSIWIKSRGLRRFSWSAQLCIGIFIGIELILRSGNLQFPSDAGGSFGLTQIPRIWNLGVDRGILTLQVPLLAMVPLGLILLAPAFLFFLYQDRRHGFSNPILVSVKSDNLWTIFGVASGIVFISCYLAGTSFDYRMIFLIPFGLLCAFSQDQQGIWRSTLTVGFLGSLLFSFMPGPAQVMGDILMTLPAAFILYLGFSSCKRLFLQRPRS